MEEKLNYNKKYKFMGITPHELFLRQNKKCWLVLAFDTYDDKEVPGELYCTDGKDYAPTKNSLNPTFECMRCLSSFVLNESDSKMSYSVNVNKLIVDILQAIGKSTEYSEDKPMIYINKQTLIDLEVFLTSTTLAHTGKEALRYKSSKLLLFGVPVIVDDTINDNILKIAPAGIEVELSI
jgi:hypothetical protein